MKVSGYNFICHKYDTHIYGANTMRLSEIYENEQRLDEVNWKQALAGAAVGAAAIAPWLPQSQMPTDLKPSHNTEKRAESPQPPLPVVQKKKQRMSNQDLARRIADVYNVSHDRALKIVHTAEKYSHDVFPKKEDILAVIGIESSFNPAAKSRLRKDPAVGLMQVRPGVWNIPQTALSTIEGQIKAGSAILASYYKKLGDPEDALHAYNIGITSFLRGGSNDRYVDKFRKAKKTLLAMTQ